MGAAPGRRIAVRIGEECGYGQLVPALVGDGLLDGPDEIHHLRPVGERGIVQGGLGRGRRGCAFLGPALSCTGRDVHFGDNIVFDGFPAIRHVDLADFRKSPLDCLPVHLQDFPAAFPIAFLRGLEHPFFCVLRGQEAGYGEKGGLEDGADFIVQADFLADAKGVYDIEPDVVGRYIGLHGVGQICFQLRCQGSVRPVGRICPGEGGGFAGSIGSGGIGRAAGGQAPGGEG